MPSPQTIAHVQASVLFETYLSNAVTYSLHNGNEACTWPDLGLPAMALAARAYGVDLDAMYRVIIASGGGQRYNQVYLLGMVQLTQSCAQMADYWQGTPSTWTPQMVQGFAPSYSSYVDLLRRYINPFNEPGVVCPF